MIAKLLVANRGEIARRIFRTCRSLGIATVAVHSDPDSDAPFVAEADERVRLPGAAPGDTYLRSDLIVAAALRTGADAVHPGYGFLSERADFAQACADAGLIFVGPSPAAIEAMGSKLAAKERMAAAGVPVLSGVDATSLDATALAAAAERIGFPVLVKASFGGGGRGMRVVRQPGDLAEAVEGAAREAASAFGDGTVFLERYVEDPRHVEIQILGDQHGEVVHLFERECSIQRRHQKILEESPSPAVDESLRARMGAAAVAAGQTIGYAGAGTVEFVLDAGGDFFFLEVNTRLQVEHPVTEAVTGLDLVRLQLLVAEGRPLPEEVRTATVRGHAIEARLYAEDPTRDWLPSTGTLHRFAVPAGDGVRVDSGFEDATVVSPHYDPMLAKVIAWAPTRHEAARRLAATLAAARIHGVTTNRDLLVGLLRHPEFLAGGTDTGFLVRHDPARLGAGRPGEEGNRLHALAAALAGQAERRRAATVVPNAPSGWRNNPSQHQQVAFERSGERVEVGYRFARDGLDAVVDGYDVAVALLSATPDAVEVEHGGVGLRMDVHTAGDEVFVDSPLGSTALRVLPRFTDPAEQMAAGSLLAPMPGNVVRVAVSAGDTVEAGEVLVVLEAMKMEHTVAAPTAGRVHEVLVAPGQQVETGTVLAVVEAGVAGDG